MPFFIAAAIGGVASLASGAIQAGGQQAAANTQQGMFNTIQGNEQPFIQAGQSATGGLNQLLGTAPGGFGGLPNGYLTQTFNPTQAQLNNYPGYQFQLQQGDQAVQNSAAATTGAVSGPALKSLSQYNQGLAASNYSNYFNQFQTQQNNIFNRLSGIATLGSNSAANLGTTGAQLGTGIAQAQAGAAGSIAGGVAGAGNNIGNNALASVLYGGSLDNSSSGGGDPLAGMSQGGYMLSDRRRKKNIEHIDTRSDGLKVYRFHYDVQTDEEPKQIGLMAQEVFAIYPDAVGYVGDRLGIDYSRVLADG